MKQYKTEVGKDFKRLVFYLCDTDNFSAYEKFLQEPAHTSEGPSEDECHSTEEDFPSTCEQIKLDEVIARTLQDELNSCNSKEVIDVPLSLESQATVTPNGNYALLTDYKDVVHELASQVQHDKHFFIVTRRKAPFSRIISLWQRQASKSHVTNRLSVHYSGESGVDNGAIALEFLQQCTADMAESMFPDGAPMDSSFLVQNGSFQTCGEIVAVSLAQGGPPPVFLKSVPMKQHLKNLT